MKKLKKLSVIACLALSISQTQASGIPVVDGANLQQSVMNYMQMIKDYEQSITQFNQMLKDTANFEKQMQEMGVGMTNINDIMGNLNQMINQMKNVYDDIANIPQDVLNNASKITNACNFIQNNSTFFQTKIKTINTKYNNQINSCLTAISDAEDFAKSIAEIEANIGKESDYDKIQEIAIQKQNLINAQQYIMQEAHKEQITKIMSFYNTYHSDQSSNPYSKASMTKDLKELSQKLQQSNNTKQAQALTNTLLLKLLESAQRQYELNMEYTKAIVKQNEALNEINYNYTQESYNNKYQKNDKKSKNLYDGLFDETPYEKNELGIPVFKIN